MPLRDHFRPPVDTIASWEGFHALWPGVIVQHLRKQLPAGYVAEPRVHLGSYVEIDVGTFETDEPPSPSDLPDYYEYEVRIYDDQRRQHLVAAIELVSPANKDRPEHRKLFVAKCAAMLQKGVAVSIVDLVTVRHFNLYAELLAFIGQSDPTLGAQSPSIYAASCRCVERGKRTLLEAWSHILTVGQPLPTLPLWLSEALCVPLNLEQSYEQTCHDLWIT